jgi:biopolymer transport protein ExbD
VAKAKKSLDAEINLVSFISLLSVCICFLLLTAGWVQVGSLNVKQAIGGQATVDTPPPVSMWARLGKDGELELRLAKEPRVPSSLARIKLKGINGKPDLDGLERHVIEVKALVPGFNMALVVPDAESIYEDIIQLMDRFKKVGIGDLGVSPL